MINGQRAIRNGESKRQDDMIDLGVTLRDLLSRRDRTKNDNAVQQIRAYYTFLQQLQDEKMLSAFKLSDKGAKIAFPAKGSTSGSSR